MNIINSVSIDKSADYQHKIQASFADKISSIKENNSRDSGILGGQAVTVEISALGAEELDKVRQSWNNHPVSTLYRTDIPVSKNGGFCKTVVKLF